MPCTAPGTSEHTSEQDNQIPALMKLICWASISQNMIVQKPKNYLNNQDVFLLRKKKLIETIICKKIFFQYSKLFLL